MTAKMISSTPDIGWCGTIDKVWAMREAGLDHVELQLVPMRLEDDAAFADAMARVRDLPLPSPVMSYLFPHDLRLVGPEVHEARARAYFDRVLQVMEAAGAKLVVYGSGWTRDVPAGFDARRGEDQYLQALIWCADALKGIGGSVVIEPLNAKETNLCHTVADGVRIARRAELANVRCLADFYHVDENGESLAEVGAFGGELAHVHLADTGRFNPGTGTYDYAAFFGALKRSGYAGRMSGECAFKGEPVSAMRQSLAFLRKAWADA